MGPSEYAVVLDGRTSLEDRTLAVDLFQHDPDCRLFIGSIGAAGVGITLTAAQLVVFAELDWVPGNVSQCEDRLHRIGQQGSVLVQHLVFDGSVDANLAATIIEKQAVIERALDRQVAPVVAPEPVKVPAPRAAAGPRRSMRETQDGSPARVVDEIPTDREIPF